MSQIYKTSTGGSLSPNVPTQFVTDNGIATPALNSLNVFGGTGTSTSGSGSTITIDTFFPDQEINLFDDFLFFNSNSNIGNFAWNSTLINNVDGTATRPGIAEIGNTISQSAGIILGASNNAAPRGNPFIFGGGSYSLNWMVNLVTLSTGLNRYIAYIGFIDNLITPIQAINAGVYFSYSDNVNSGNWVLNCTTGGVTTSSNTSVAADTSFHDFKITVNAAGTLATFFIDNVSLGTIATNIPVTSGNASCPGFVMTNAAATFPAALIDLFYMTYTLTTAR